ncbi:MAG: family 43 glycosylhydrolase [Lachnospiraceae bacterium]|nr:family 43 glycosylhydrolase [Lachnospiraceae bacterium]
MKNQLICSPYLPGWEYIPDGEPHVFGDRIYIFGSHDQFGGKRFCMKDYTVWSAPLSDLSDWSTPGVSYRKDQDPYNTDGKYELWAPDVAQGPDGRFYLYYCLANQPRLGVAVSEKPDGPYEFLAHVHDASGAALGSRDNDMWPFDPGILVDTDGRIHLYAGQSPMFPAQAKKATKSHQYTWHMELEQDMVTLKTEPTPLLPNILNSAGTGFEHHEFFEASSIRHFGDHYYFIYSSVQSHELCWAISDRPDGGFKFGGTLVSNGDIGLHGDAVVSFNSGVSLTIRNYVGNNHGSVERINGRYYIFYHRQTNRHMYSRQACVAPIEMRPDGSFVQAEMTSSGLADALPGKGTFEARIACELYSKKGALFGAHPLIQNKKHPAFTQDEPDGEGAVQYIENLRDGATAVFKYFDFEGGSQIRVKARGKCRGQLLVRDAEHGPVLASIQLAPAKAWTEFSADFFTPKGRSALYFTYEGKGYADFLEFTLA